MLINKKNVFSFFFFFILFLFFFFFPLTLMKRRLPPAESNPCILKIFWGALSPLCSVCLLLSFILRIIYYFNVGFFFPSFIFFCIGTVFELVIYFYHFILSGNVSLLKIIRRQYVHLYNNNSVVHSRRYKLKLIGLSR